MTALRQRMIEDMRVRNFTPNTQRAYLDRVTKIRTVFRKITGVSRSTIPKFLSPDQVRQVLTECDQNSALGMRNYAILLLLSRLGFRATNISTGSA